MTLAEALRTDTSVPPGRRVAAWRAVQGESGWSILEAAARIGIAPGTLAKVEHEREVTPRILRKVQAFTGVPAAHFLEAGR